MFHLSTTLNLQLKLPVVLEIIVRRVVSALRAQQASIMLFDPETGELETRAAYGLEAEFTRGARVKLGERIAGRVAETGEPALLNRTPDDAEYGRHYKNDRNITSALSLPLRVGERCIGVLNVNRINHPETFEDHHREILSMFAEHVAAVIERAEVLDRLGSRSRELEEANLRLTQLNAMKDVFLSTASHELKTPLTSVIAYAELLDEQAERLNQEQRSNFLHRLRTEAERLMGLIEDILDLTRLESGKMTLKPAPLSVNEVALAAVETNRPMAAKHDVKVVEQLEAALPALELDAVKMGQVVTNLIGNAIKFSPRGGTVTIRTQREPKWVRVDVVDQGPGVGPEEATHIFELFGQGAGGGDGRDAGVGIGLHLVKRIAELHGGHVGVISAIGEGSTFWVRLPIPASRPAEADALSTAA
jgi:signal transduction histidine kinase